MKKVTKLKTTIVACPNGKVTRSMSATVKHRDRKDGGSEKVFELGFSIPATDKVMISWTGRDLKIYCIGEDEKDCLYHILKSAIQALERCGFNGDRAQFREWQTIREESSNR